MKMLDFSLMKKRFLSLTWSRKLTLIFQRPAFKLLIILPKKVSYQES